MVSMRSAVAGKRQLFADSALVGATFVWGATFVLVKDVVGSTPVMLFLAARFTLAALAMALVVTIAGRWKGLSVREVAWGSGLGVLIWAGYTFQTVGLQ